MAVHPDQISQNQLGEYVYVVDNNNTLEIRQVKSSYANNDLVVISEGLNEGDKVVVGTINGLHNGLVVTPTKIPNPIQIR